MRTHASLATLLVILFAVSACTGTAGAPVQTPTSAGSAASSSASSSAGTRQTSEGGQVTVVASWPGPTAGATFDVALDTHSVDLDALDLANAGLRNDRGETLTARAWAAPKGGHHREGALAFGGEVSSFFAGARWIEMTLVGVGDIPERTLRWELGS